MMTTTREKKRRGLSMIVNQFSGERSGADVASLNFAKEIVAETLTLTTRPNAMIAAGVSFKVGTDDFQAFGASERENAFLRENQREILCLLQQGWLAECLFKHSPALLEDFTVEVVERSAIMTDGAEVEPCFEAVREVTAIWFNEQIAKL